MNIKLILFLILIPFLAISHEVNIEDKSVEEVVKQRMANMSKIKAYSSKMYPMTMSGEFVEIKEVNEKLLHISGCSLGISFIKAVLKIAGAVFLFEGSKTIL